MTATQEPIHHTIRFHAAGQNDKSGGEISKTDTPKNSLERLYRKYMIYFRGFMYFLH